MTYNERVTQYQLQFREYKRDISSARIQRSYVATGRPGYSLKSAAPTRITGTNGTTITVTRDLPDPILTPTVHGYFFGGGWAFGLAESESFRITGSSYHRYLATSSGPLTITYLDKAGKTYTKEVIVGRDIPAYNQLTRLDQPVKRGDPVVVKLEAYPFTRYGALAGELEHVSPDAVADERRGLVFPARVKLTRRTLDVSGRPAQLSPGMAVVAEVVTGRRRVIDYLLSPVARATQEAGRER